MIQIIKAIAEKLHSEFNIPVYSDNTKEVFDKESFFVEVASDSVGLLATSFLETVGEIRITYFPVDSTRIKEVLQMRDSLSLLFMDGFEVNDRFFIRLENNIQFTITSNNILEMLLPIHYVNEVVEEGTEEMIEEIETRL